MTAAPTFCPISGDQIQEFPTDGAYRNIRCPSCGDYKIARTVESTLTHNSTEKAILSHYIRQKNEANEQPIFRGNLITRIIKEFSLPGPAEQVDNLILRLGRNTVVGQIAQFPLPTLTASIGALDSNNTIFICQYSFSNEFVMHDNRELSIVDHQAPVSLGLTMKGWERFYELEKGKIDSRLAFMAMPFGDARLDEIYLTWFKPACKAVGFDLRRVDEKPEAGIINNKMMVDIRKSRFVIAELTKENRGVYWEAGFAEGLNRPVIYTCDKTYKDDLEKKGESIHFDIRQHHTVFWTDKNLLEAAQMLAITIQATIPEAKLIDVDEINNLIAPVT